MLTKKQSQHPQKVFQVFQVFRVFQVFHFAFGPQNSPFLVQIRTKPKNRYPPTSAIKWVRKTPKKAIHPPADEHDNVLQAIGAVFFSAKPTFCSLPSHSSHHSTQATQPHQIKQPLSKRAVNEIAMGIWQKNVGWALCISHFFIFLQSTSNRH